MRSPTEGQPDAPPPLDQQETVLLGVVIAHLCFLPWALGTMHVWSQLASLGLAGLGFMLAVVPRHEAGRFKGTSSASPPASRLLRLPVFWGGLLMLGYIALQGANPAWRFMSTEESWWLEPAAHVTWLPAGISAPFGRSNPWRALVIYGSLWLVVCSVWCGFQRRRSYRILFTALVGNALLLALLGLAQQLSGTRRIFWCYVPGNTAFSGSFIYPNHAGAYLNLMVALAAGLALWSHRRSRHGLESPGAAVAFTLAAAFAGLMVIFSYSRASIVVLLAFTLLSGCALAFRVFRRRGPAGGDRPEFLPLALTLAGFLAIGLVSANTAKVRARFAELLADPATAGLDRTQARQAAADMWRERWLLGWGAGCFRHGFPLFAQNHPLIYNSPGGGRKYWEHAHNDLLEFPVEFGVAGLLPLAGIFAHWAWQLRRRRFWRNAVSFSLALGGGLALLHAGVDFVLQCPAVLLTGAVLLTAALRWAELDEAGIRRPPAPRA